jgi:hypothetical protein
MPSSDTAITIGGVTCWDEGTIERFARYRSTATRTLLCAWTDRVALIEYLRGGSVDTSSGWIVTVGNYPDFPFLFIESVTCEGVAGPGGLSVGPNGVVAYQYARLRATYATFEYQPGTETGTMGLDFGSQVLTLPQSTSILQYGDGASEDLPPEDAPPLIIPTVAITRTVKDAPSIPMDTILACIQAPVNSASFLGADPGYVLFDGGRSLRRLTTAGAINYDLEYRFQYRAIPWNQVYANGGDSGPTRPVIRKADGLPLYASSDLNGLFEL